MKHGLIADIYKDGSDCTAGGVSANVTRMKIVGEGITGPFPPNKDEVYLQVIKRNLFGEPYFHCEPYVNGEPLPKPGLIGPMMGGNFAYTSDSRFRQVSKYPIGIHDRYETQQAYDALSR